MAAETLARAAALGFEDYHPGLVAEAVNELAERGDEGALQPVEQYLSQHDPAQPPLGLFWVLRVLFDVPGDAGFPPVRIGSPTVPEPDDSSALPRFPIVLAADVPLLAVRGYDLAGFAEPVEAHVTYYREHGRVRARPLSPAPEHALADFERQWARGYAGAPPGEGSDVVREQLERLRAGTTL
ncbi:MAG TPA: hypothetical protein VFG79_08885 [Solirubrobacter sp.]|nr:hypothetical protein [Solirubrobacter sp.]